MGMDQSKATANFNTTNRHSHDWNLAGMDGTSRQTDHTTTAARPPCQLARNTAATQASDRSVSPVICAPIPALLRSRTNCFTVQRRRGTACRCPDGPGNSGSPGCPPRSASQDFRIRTVAGSSGVSRSFRPLPVQWTCGPAWIRMSEQVRPVSSETRRPAWTARASMAWSRRPVRVSWSQAARSASVSSGVR